MPASQTRRQPNNVDKASSRRKKTHKNATPRLSPRKVPDGMDAAAWQRALRRQFGREQSFNLENLGDDALFSEFRVHNPESGRAYRVRIRGLALGDNQCSCADFQTNELGTCKHVEFVLSRLERKRGAKSALKRGYRPPYSELLLRPGAPRALRLRLGARRG